MVIPALLCIIIGITLSIGCMDTGTGSPLPSAQNIPARTSTPVDLVEVYHFHPTQQCYSCKTIGNYTEEAITTSFAPELASGKLVFKHLNYGLPENADLVKKYGVTGSSLWIGTSNATGFYKEQDVKVWYLIGNKDVFMAYIKEKVKQKLNGM
jgi:hypothetical protein